MDIRPLVAFVGLIELLAPRRFIRFWLARLTHNPREIELREWAVLLLRVNGLILLGWAVFRGGDGRTVLKPPSDSRDDLGSTPSQEGSESVPALRPGTARYNIAVALYRADEAVPVSELVERSQETDWEVGRSTASATLYRMFQDGLVERRERENARGYEYWLTPTGRASIARQGGRVESSSPFGRE